MQRDALPAQRHELIAWQVSSIEVSRLCEFREL
jgi:hypothetical protein